MHKAILLSIALALTANCVRAPAHIRHAHAHAKVHVYDVPLQEVWPFALQLLEEKGYQIDKNISLESGARYSAETLWAGEGTQQVRVIVQGKSYSTSGNSQVSFSRQERQLGSSDIKLKRDLDLEWALIRLVDPESAAKIQADGPDVGSAE